MADERAERAQRFSRIKQTFPELNNQFHRTFLFLGITNREAVAATPDHVFLAQRGFGLRSLRRLRASFPYAGNSQENTKPCTVCGGTGRVARRA